MRGAPEREEREVAVVVARRHAGAPSRSQIVSHGKPPAGRERVGLVAAGLRGVQVLAVRVRRAEQRRVVAVERREAAARAAT